MRATISLEELVKTVVEELGEGLSAGHMAVELGIEQVLVFIKEELL